MRVDCSFGTFGIGFGNLGIAGSGDIVSDDPLTAAFRSGVDFEARLPRLRRLNDRLTLIERGGCVGAVLSLIAFEDGFLWAALAGRSFNYSDDCQCTCLIRLIHLFAALCLSVPADISALTAFKSEGLMGVSGDRTDDRNAENSVFEAVGLSLR